MCPLPATLELQRPDHPASSAMVLPESLSLLSSCLWKDEGGYADGVCRVFISHRQNVLEVIL